MNRLLIVLILATFMSHSLWAKEGQVNLHLEPSLCASVDRLNYQFKRPGTNMGVRVSWQLSSFIAPQLSFSYIYLLNTDQNRIDQNNDRVFDVPSVGAGLRFFLLDTDLVNFWADANGQFYVAEHPMPQLNQRNGRFAFNFGAGIGLNLGDSFSFGPYARYDQVIYPDVEDLKVVSVGINLTFRFGGASEEKKPQAPSPVEKNTDDTEASGEVSDQTELKKPRRDKKAIQIGDVSEEEAAPDEVIAGSGDIQDGADSEFFCEDADRLASYEKVYFNFDRFEIRPSETDHLQESAECLLQFMKKNPSTVVVLAGHCDERGSHEYNLALGSKRALSVKQFLVKSGINPSRIKTVSYGEERPESRGHSEAAWSKNRRVEFEKFSKKKK